MQESERPKRPHFEYTHHLQSAELMAKMTERIFRVDIGEKLPGKDCYLELDSGFVKVNSYGQPLLSDFIPPKEEPKPIVLQ